MGQVRRRIETTQRYAHLCPTKLAAMVKALDKVVGMGAERVEKFATRASQIDFLFVGILLCLIFRHIL